MTTLDVGAMERKARAELRERCGSWWSLDELLAEHFGYEEAQHIAACSPANIVALLGKLKAAEKDAALWRKSVLTVGAAGP